MLTLMHKIITNLKYIYIPFFPYQIGRNPKPDNILKQHFLSRQARTSLLRVRRAFMTPLCGPR